MANINGIKTRIKVLEKVLTPTPTEPLLIAVVYVAPDGDGSMSDSDIDRHTELKEKYDENFIKRWKETEQQAAAGGFAALLEEFDRDDFKRLLARDVSEINRFKQTIR